MVAKITQRDSFSRIVNYINDVNKQAIIIDSEGVRLRDNQSIISSFELQRSMNERVKNPVYHISLSFSKNDREKIHNKFMAQIAREYLKAMGLDNTQFVAVRHKDKNHDHMHLCINRIDNDGNLISDRHDRTRSSIICKLITAKHNLYFAPNKNRVNVDRLQGSDKVKYEIFKALKDAKSEVKNWDQLRDFLKGKDIDLKFVNRGNTDEIQGVIFSKGKYKFNGSKIDRQFSYSKLDRLFNGEDLEKESKWNPYVSQTEIRKQSLSFGNLMASFGASFAGNSDVGRIIKHFKDEDEEEQKNKRKRGIRR